MTEPLSKIPGGMRYYFGEEARLRRAVEDTVMSVFDGWSYEEIMTPSVDYYALFERGMGHDEAHRAFRFADSDGRMVALRPDVTSSVARAAATLFKERERPLRLCYAASVFRQRPRSHAEWRRESRHLGCELIGAGTGAADMEILVVAAELLERLGLREQSRITVNNVEVFNGVAERLGLDAEKREQMRHIVDTKDSDELRRFLAGYKEPATDPDAFGRQTRLSGKRDIISEARRVIKNPRSRRALKSLEELWNMIELLGLSKNFEIDLSDVSGLDYYTGLVFRIYVEGAGVRVGGGGRYDDLTKNFGHPEPAVGFILDLDALTDMLIRNGSGLAHEMNRTKPSPVEGDDAAETFLEAKLKREAGERIKIGMRDEG